MTLTTKKNWKTVKLGEVANVIPGYAFKGEHFGDMGVPIVKITEIQPPYVSFEKSQKVDVSNYDEAKLRKYQLRKGDYVVAMTGATIGKVGKIVDDVDALLNQRVAKIQAKEGFDNKYVYYQVFSDSFYKYIQQVSAGSSAQQNVSGGDIERYEIKIPESLDEQREIAGVLGCLDDKIELLRKENKTLEEIAQTLFKEWFVHFNFPGSTGKMTDSELGPTPEGWRVGKFTDVAEILSGGTPKTDEKKFWNGEIPFFTPKDAVDSFYVLETEKHITEEGLSSCNSALYPVDTVFITARGTVGKCVLSGREMAMNQSCYAIRGKKYSNLFIFLLTKYLVSSLRGMASGGVFDAITIQTFETTEVVIPTEDLVKDFECATAPIFEKNKANNIEIQTLSKLRDELLNKIFSV